MIWKNLKVIVVETGKTYKITKIESSQSDFIGLSGRNHKHPSSTSRIACLPSVSYCFIKNLTRLLLFLCAATTELLAVNQCKSRPSAILLCLFMKLLIQRKWIFVYLRRVLGSRAWFCIFIVGAEAYLTFTYKCR